MQWKLLLALETQAHGAGLSLEKDLNFKVTLYKEKDPLCDALSAQIASQAELMLLYQTWEKHHKAYINRKQRGIKASSGKKVSEPTFDLVLKSFQDLERQMRSWLATFLIGGVQLDLWLRKKITDPKDKIRITYKIPEESLRLAKLPWHCWDFMKTYKNAEISFSLPERENPLTLKQEQAQPKILSILGDSTGIDPKSDLRFTKKIVNVTGAHHKIIEPPDTSKETIKDELVNGCNILFFSGHSRTDLDTSSGQLLINATTMLSITDISSELSEAIESGLQIAIFNSCDGIGIAKDLSKLHLPCSIVMREPVPDEVAINFFRVFLRSYCREGRSIDLAFRAARESLQDTNSNCPGASHLPVLFLNPTCDIPSWTDLFPQRRASPRVALSAALTSFLLITLIRSIGLLQGVEQTVYDLTIQHRYRVSSLLGQDLIDDKIALVTITDRDRQMYGDKEEGYSINDQNLKKVLDRIYQEDPALVVLDIYRPSESQNDLEELYETEENLLSICDETGIEPVPQGFSAQRTGIANVHDRVSGEIASRSLPIQTFRVISSFGRDPDGRFGQWPDEQCGNKFISVLVAERYLSINGLPGLEEKNGIYTLGGKPLPPLEEGSGFFQRINSEGVSYGYQLLIDYLAPHNPFTTEPRFEELTIDRLISRPDNNLPVNLTDKIVFVIALQSEVDRHPTPFNTLGIESYDLTPGGFILAEITSQLIDYVEGKRKLLWFPHGSIDLIWIAVWAALGAVTGRFFSGYEYKNIKATLSVVVLLSLTLLYIINLSLFILVSLILPYLPPGIAYLLTTTSIIGFWSRRSDLFSARLSEPVSELASKESN